MISKTTERLSGKMDTTRWQRVKAILGEALEQESPSARATFLRRSCADDPTLRHEVELLLSHAATAGDELDDCAENAAAMLGRDEPLRSGRRLGAYEILQEIGRGGMGAVYLAARADGQFEKRVAIKLLKRGTDTDEMLRRFRAERQILARLDHPNISRLLDAGTTDDGLPYFVMDYIDGQPITAFARERKLPITERLQLFLKVCAAVSFAHQNRVVHRDLKANNILVQADGEPKLLDFGIAKLVAADHQIAELTGTRNRRLTPICASPEQARGETVTAVSDVYALGALLYELLTDILPHRFATTHPPSDEVARVVCEQEPTAPSLATPDRDARRKLSGDLDNIVLYAMRKEPARRYQSVAELAGDLRRHLAGRPVQARRNTTAYRAQRFIARNRKEAVLVTVAFLLAAGAVWLTLSFAPRWKDQSGESSNHRAIPPEKSIAVLPFQQIGGEKADGFFADGVQDNITTDLAKVADLKVISQSSVARYREGNRDARAIGAALGVSHLLQGSVQRSGNRLRVNAQLIDTRTGAQSWAEHYDREVTDLFAIQNQLAHQIVAQLKATLSTKEKAALAQQPTNDLPAYELYLRAGSLIHEFGIGPVFRTNAAEAIELLKKAIARDPNFALAHCLLAETHLYLYRYYDPKPERLAEAQEMAERALRVAPATPESHLMKARFNYFGLHDFAAAEKELRAAAPGLPNNAALLDLSSVVQRRMGHWAAAWSEGEKAAQLDPHQPGRLLALAESYHALRRFDEAERLAERAIASLPPKASGAFSWLKSTAALGRGDVPSARAALETATGGMLETRVRLAQVLVLAREFAAAEREVEAIQLRQPGDHRIYVVRAMIAQGNGNPDEARLQYEKARALFSPVLRQRPNDPELYAWLGPIEAALGHKEEALRAARHATELVPVARDQVDGPVYEAALAQTYAILDQRDAALEILERLVKLPCAPLLAELKLDSRWDNLRGDPRFDRIIVAAGEPLRLN